MKVFFHTYTLSSKYLRRTGALLKVVFEEGSAGYCDCHPWVELGDASLSDQLSLLKQGKTTPLTSRSLEFAKLDAEARQKGVHLFANLKSPKNHLLVYDFDAWKGDPSFSVLKLKVGKETPFQQLEHLFHTSSKKIRLDANRKFDYEQCREFLKRIAPWHSRIDLFEDPIPYDPTTWKALQDEFSIPLALDHHSERYLGKENPHRISIVKAAVQNLEPFQNDDRKLVFTSYLDHPIGQLSALYAASKTYSQFPEKTERCGLITHVVYAPNAFSERLQIREERLVPPTDGTGFGFDDLLEKIPWELLC